MPKLRVVSGKALVKLLKFQGFVVERISGSHVILITPDKQDVVVIPLHSALDKGTLSSIIKVILPFVSEKLIKKHLFR